MARIRTIKPDFYSDEDLAELSHVTRLAFPGLWCLADGFGRLEDRPKRIRAQLFPYEPEVDMESILEELAGARFIIRYQVDGVRLIQVRTFRKHQRITGKEATQPSSFPPPPGDKSGNQRGNSGETSGESMGKQQGNEEETPDDAPVFQEREREREREREGEGKGATPPAPLGVNPYELAFDTLGVLDAREFRFRLEAKVHEKSSAAFEEWSAMDPEVKRDWVVAAFEVADSRRTGGSKVFALVAGIIVQALQEGQAPAAKRPDAKGATQAATRTERSEAYETARKDHYARKAARDYPNDSSRAMADALRTGGWDDAFHRAIRSQADELDRKLADIHPNDTRGRSVLPTQYPLAALAAELAEEEGR